VHRIFPERTFRINSGPLINLGGWIHANTRVFNMQKSNSTALETWTVLLCVLLISACAGTQINTELPANHPANPAAEAAVFTPPPNPFLLTVSEAPPVSPPADTGVHPKPQEGAEHTHGMGPMKPPSAAPADSMQKDSGHQH